MIDPLSLIPLHVETFFDNKLNGMSHIHTKIADATAFIYSTGWKNYLITNWHVVSGRHPETEKILSKYGSLPNIIKVWFHGPGEDLNWLQSSILLLDWETDEKLWKEHPSGREVDLVAIPLDGLSIFNLHPLDPMLFSTDLNISPSEAVSIIGFPFGLTSTGVLPIWKTGYVASDIEYDYNGKPTFLIDANTKPGMSGSPVIARRKKIVNENKIGVTIITEIDKFLGVYSGRISNKYDTGIGIVWKPELINEIIENRDEVKLKTKKYKTINLLHSDNSKTRKIKPVK